MEQWKPIKGYEDYYEISSYGNIRSKDRIVERSLPNGTIRYSKQKGKPMFPQINKGTRSGVKPRYEIRLSKNGKSKGFQMHRLVAKHFLKDYKDKLEVNHIDGNPLNNNVSNLEMVTREENIRHAFRNKLVNTSHTVLQYDLKGNLVAEHYSESEACRSIGINSNWYIHRAIIENRMPYKGYYWKYKECRETIENTSEEDGSE